MSGDYGGGGSSGSGGETGRMASVTPRGDVGGDAGVGLGLNLARRGKSKKQIEAEAASAAQANYLSSTADSRAWRAPSSRAAQALASTGSSASVARKSLLGS